MLFRFLLSFKILFDFVIFYTELTDSRQLTEDECQFLWTCALSAWTLCDKLLYYRGDVRPPSIPVTMETGHSCSLSALTFFVVCLTFLVDLSAAQTICTILSQGGYIDRSLKIDTANSPCIVHKSVIIAPKTTLTLDPGVQLWFDPGVMLAINGTLLARVRCTSLKL